jgi:hypothetical protein
MDHTIRLVGWGCGVVSGVCKAQINPVANKAL